MIWQRRRQTQPNKTTARGLHAIGSRGTGCTRGLRPGRQVVAGRAARSGARQRLVCRAPRTPVPKEEGHRQKTGTFDALSFRRSTPCEGVQTARDIAWSLSATCKRAGPAPVAPIGQVSWAGTSRRAHGSRDQWACGQRDECLPVREFQQQGRVTDVGLAGLWQRAPAGKVLAPQAWQRRNHLRTLGLQVPQQFA